MLLHMNIAEMLAEVVRLNASDLHLTAGFPPMIRVDGALLALVNFPRLTEADTAGLVDATLTPEQRTQFAANKEVDYAISSANARFRVNAFFQKNTVAAAFRYITNKIRSIDELGLPPICHEFVKLRQGFILVTGPTGHGKTTSLAAMINSINMKRSCHILTIEDPIEYIYPPGLSIISQREMHQDSHSWNMSLRSSLREDPDVVLVGEMRDYETIQAAITVAETGHLVFATLHTNSAAQTVDRIVDVFPENQQPQVRLQLSSVLEGVISQRLIPSVAGGRVVCTEIMTATSAVKATVRDGKTHLLDNIIQTSADVGMMTFEMSLARAVQEGRISVETATQFALRPQELGRLLHM